jgi:hypothetical protein
MQQEDDDEKSEVGDFEIDPRCEGSDPFKPLHYQHVSDCTKFYKCYMGKAYVIKCPRGQHWSQKMNRCEHPSLARCSISKPAEIKPAQTSWDDEEEYYYDEDPIYVEEADFKIDDARCLPDPEDINHPIQFSHSTDCGAFYKCFDHRAYKIKCPAGLHYSVDDEACNYTWLAKCKIGFMQASEMFNTPSIPACPQGDVKENFAVENSFTLYFACINGLSYLMECEAEELFNPMTKHCEKFSMPQYPGMMMPPNMMMPNFPNFQYQGMNPQYPSIPMAPQPQNPQYPNYPGMNQPLPNYPQYPAMPMAPQPGPQKPEFPSWMPIPNQNIPLPNLPVPQEKPSHDKPGDKDAFHYEEGKVSARCPNLDNPTKPQHLSHEIDCKKFYKCFNGRAFLMECPESQEWSDELQRCDYHQFANCDPIELIKKKMQL